MVYNFYNEMTSIMDISAIVHTEQSRIDQKAVGIRNALDSQNRMIFLNQSYASRMKEYSFMIMIIALTIVIIVFILFFKNLLPESLVNIIVLIVGTIGGIWALVVYIGIQQRDTVDFDKVYSVPPANSDNSGNVFISSVDTRSLSEVKLRELLNGTCYGQACCGPETTFTQGQCLPGSGRVSAFTSMEQAYNNNNSNTELTKNISQNNNLTHSSLIFSSYP